MRECEHVNQVANIRFGKQSHIHNTHMFGATSLNACRIA